MRTKGIVLTKQTKMGFTLKNPPANGNIMLNKAHFFTTKKDKNHTIEQKKNKKKTPIPKEVSSIIFM